MKNNLNFILALTIGFFIAIIIGKPLIEKLRRLKYGQSIRKEGPKAHLEKSGTPTMGGIMFLCAFLITIIINFNFNFKLILLLVSTFGLALVGFIDDYKIIKYKTNEGITAKQKIFGQFLVGLIVSLIGYYFLGSEIYIPIFNLYLDLKLFYILFNIIFIVALANSVNLTDGLDGLSTSVTIIVLSFFSIVSFLLKGDFVLIVSMAMIGSLLGFLYFNWNPAKIFMGDVGSLALGGFVASLAIVLKLQLIVPIIGIIYFVETASVIIQVYYFKKHGKRVFKMTPIHHHYELLGNTEKDIVKKFSLVTLLGLIISLLLLFH